MGRISREDLFREIGEIDEAYVEEARRAGRSRRVKPWVGGTLAVAASLVFCLGVGYAALQLMPRMGGTGGDMEGAPSANGTAMEAAQDSFSTGEEAGAEEAFTEEKAGQMSPETAPREAPPDQGSAYDAVAEGSMDTEQTAASPVREDQGASAESSLLTDLQGVKENLIQSGDATELTWEEVRTDAVYGRYVDVSVPEGYDYTSGALSPSALYVTWNKGLEEITIVCRQADESVSDWLVDAENPEEYDLGLYSDLLSENVPQELYISLANATFRADQITPEIVAARTCQAAEDGTASGSRTSINILYRDNVLVEISGRGPSAEEIYTLINLEN
ncbi:MAG: hypothetical protein HFH80_12350 [Lachnospiraceae bacterium]|nr:hypothetical protein [Lachnospiraceae bacterium]